MHTPGRTELKNHRRTRFSHFIMLRLARCRIKSTMCEKAADLATVGERFTARMYMVKPLAIIGHGSALVSANRQNVGILF